MQFSSLYKSLHVNLLCISPFSIYVSSIKNLARGVFTRQNVCDNTYDTLITLMYINYTYLLYPYQLVTYSIIELSNQTIYLCNDYSSVEQFVDDVGFSFEST